MPEIAGYTAPSKDKIALVNDNKFLEEIVLRQIDRHATGNEGANVDQRFVALARTHVQTAFMMLNRAVFQPQRVVPQSMQELEDFEIGVESLVRHLLRS